MADRQDSDREVLTSLPRTRPVRRSAKRGDRAGQKTPAASTTARRAASSKPKPKPAAAKATTARAASAKPKAAKATTARAASAKPRAAKAGPTAAPRRTAAEQSRAAPRRKVPPAGYAAPTSRDRDGGGAGTADLLSTTIQAAAELAQIGMTVGRQTLRSMIDRLPKP